MYGLHYDVYVLLQAAHGFGEGQGPVGSYQKTKPEASSVGAKNLRSRFEQMAQAGDEEARKRAQDEKAKREAREKREREESEQKEKVGLLYRKYQA